jgi:hypothetical protein
MCYHRRMTTLIQVGNSATWVNPNEIASVEAKMLGEDTPGVRIWLTGGLAAMGSRQGFFVRTDSLGEAEAIVHEFFDRIKDAEDRLFGLTRPAGGAG